MYTLSFSKAVQKRLMRMPRPLADRILSKLEALAVDPYSPSHNVKKLVNREGYRLRVGDWRVIFEINDGQLMIFVIALDTRGGVYK
jgi:mRNA interferase RelE/StbE